MHTLLDAFRSSVSFPRTCRLEESEIEPTFPWVGLPLESQPSPKNGPDAFINIKSGFDSQKQIHTPTQREIGLLQQQKTTIVEDDGGKNTYKQMSKNI